jgi:hypothetical protein
MIEDKVEIEIELPEEDWVALEDCRVEFGFETMDELIGYILEKELKRYSMDNNVSIKHNGR